MQPQHKALEKFWENQKTTAWFKEHPILHEDAGTMEQAVSKIVTVGAVVNFAIYFFDELRILTSPIGYH